MAQESGQAGVPSDFRDQIREPEYVIVTPEMVSAGLDRLSDLPRDEDPAYLVEAVYMAMEYERRSRG
jgi:hypothetical protein